MIFDKKILSLIETKKEGDYWDFKEEHHKNKADLLHDIICLANSLYDGDKYIIYGVRNNTGEILDVSANTPRRKQADIIDFLRSSNFFASIFPEIELRELTIDEKAIDVLIIKNSNNVPYYLIETFIDKQQNTNKKNIDAFKIYSRTMDTNTPKDKSATPQQIENLWRKHFGLDKTGMSKFILLLDDHENWYKDLGNKKYMYHQLYPEYKIEIFELGENDWEFKDFYTNENSYVFKAKFYFHSTILYETEIYAVDEFRKYISAPQNGFIIKMDKHPLKYYYYCKTDLNGKLLKVLTGVDYNFSSRETWCLQFLIFENQNMREDYEIYANENYSKITEDEILKYYYTFNNKNDNEEKKHNIILAYILYKNWGKGEIPKSFSVKKECHPL